MGHRMGVWVPSKVSMQFGKPSHLNPSGTNGPRPQLLKYSVAHFMHGHHRHCLPHSELVGNGKEAVGMHQLPDHQGHVFLDSKRGCGYTKHQMLCGISQGT